MELEPSGSGRALACLAQNAAEREPAWGAPAEESDACYRPAVRKLAAPLAADLDAEYLQAESAVVHPAAQAMNQIRSICQYRARSPAADHRHGPEPAGAGWLSPSHDRSPHAWESAELVARPCHPTVRGFRVHEEEERADDLATDYAEL